MTRSLLLAAGLLALAMPGPAAEKEHGEIDTDSQARYVHRLTLYDSTGTILNPSSRTPEPFSMEATCGRCHDFKAIGRGWHFNAPLADADHGRPGQPWILTDEATGTQLPVSPRPWPGMFQPADLGMSPWDFIKAFGSHLPGGGYGLASVRETLDEAQDPGDGRWFASRDLEINCFLCHLVNQRPVDLSEWGKAIEVENFAWASLTAMSLGSVKGDTTKMPEDFDPDFPPLDMEPGGEGPKLEYDKSRFDPDGLIFFDLDRKAPADSCYVCHSHREAGEGARAKWQWSQDIHLASGMSCTDCHRNGIDHQIVRGFEGEEHGGATGFSCAECHEQGTYGAPYPEHEGLPLLHFEKLTCTACHSGPAPREATVAMQTSLSHGLGLATTTRGDNDMPHITGPVFIREAASGKIAPHRLMFPAYWGVRADGKITPLLPEVVAKVAGKALASKSEDAGEGAEAGEARIQAGLAALAEGGSLEGDPVYVAAGLVHELRDGKLASAADSAAAPVAWPIGHNVRPERQALGANGCQDCHAADSPIVFGVVDSLQPFGIAMVKAPTMAELRADPGDLYKVWPQAFTFRPLFKVFGFAAAGLVGLVLMLAGFRGLGGLMRLFDGRRQA